MNLLRTLSRRQASWLQWVANGRGRSINSVYPKDRLALVQRGLLAEDEDGCAVLAGAAVGFFKPEPGRAVWGLERKLFGPAGLQVQERRTFPSWRTRPARPEEPRPGGTRHRAKRRQLYAAVEAAWRLTGRPESVLVLYLRAAPPGSKMECPACRERCACGNEECACQLCGTLLKHQPGFLYAIQRPGKRPPACRG